MNLFYVFSSSVYLFHFCSDYKYTKIYIAPIYTHMQTPPAMFSRKYGIKSCARLLFSVRKPEENTFSSGTSSCLTPVEIRTSSLCWMLEVLGVSRLTSCSGTWSSVIYKPKQYFKKRCNWRMDKHFLFEGSNTITLYFSTESHLYVHLHKAHQRLNYNLKNNAVFYYVVVLGPVFSCILYIRWKYLWIQ